MLAVVNIGQTEIRNLKRKWNKDKEEELFLVELSLTIEPAELKVFVNKAPDVLRMQI